MPTTLKPYLLTFHDLLEYARLYTDANNTSRTTNQLYAAVREALRQVTQGHDWQYLWTYDRLDLQAFYNTGTVTYDYASNVLTLDSGTFPSWAAQGWVKIPDNDGINYQVQTRLTDTTVELHPTYRPTADITTASDYNLFQSSYLLPPDFVRMSEPIHQDWQGMEYHQPTQVLFQEVRIESFGTPYHYTIQGSTDFRGQFEAKFFPAPDQDRPLHYLYLRRPRPLMVSGWAKSDKTGTVTTDGSTTTVTGTGTTWTSRHEGALIRFSEDTTAPTGMDGQNPYSDERTVISVTNNTTLVVDQAPPALTGVAFVISDYVDIDESLVNYLLTCIDYKVTRRARDYKLVQNALMLAMQEETKAKEADSRVVRQRHAKPVDGVGGWGRVRIWNP